MMVAVGALLLVASLAQRGERLADPVLARALDAPLAANEVTKWTTSMATG